jgi:hypothetical protein
MVAGDPKAERLIAPELTLMFFSTRRVFAG